MAEILQYVQKDGLFHRLHPITKIVFVIVISVISIFTTSIPFLLLILSILFILAYLGDVFPEIIHQFVLIAIMSVIMIGIAIITLPNGPVLGTLIPEAVPVIGGAVPITLGGLAFGVIMALRFAVLVVAVQFFVISTRPRDLIHTLERLHVPVDFILMFVIALRFIPTLQIEGTRIQEAQLARGYDPGTGVGGKIQRFVPVMVPLVSNALSRANVLGLTIDIRGYRTRTRTRLREFPFQNPDYLAFIVMIALFLGYILLMVKQII